MHPQDWLGLDKASGGADTGLMDELVIRPTRDQLRTIGYHQAICPVMAIVLILAAVLAGGSLGATLELLAAGFGIGSVPGVLAYLIYARSFTECSQAGIRTSGLARQRQCPWSAVAEMGLRPFGRMVTVTVTTTSATRFRLGAPVDGNYNMRDPEFASKIAAIQQYWLTAALTPPAVQ
jgi:hypothetical protein